MNTITYFLSIIYIWLSLISPSNGVCNNELCLAGTCTDQNCTCSISYPNCTKPVNTTCDELGDFCLNGGSCNASSGSFQCICPEGFSGSRCEIKPCNTSLCSNNGNCTEDTLTGSRTCSCNRCYTGPNCSMAVNFCANYSCNQHGSCWQVCKSNSLDLSCQCDKGWFGSLCQFDKNECDESPCKNGATCSNLPGTYSCACTPGWNGTNCELNINECLLPGYCVQENTRLCADIDGSYNCTCKAGYRGVNCETPFCEPGLCNHNGNCSTDSLQWMCDCNEYFEGKTCEIRGPCLDEPCIHGTCSQSNSTGTLTHACTCETGYKNISNCNEDINECEEIVDLCQNSGECINNNGSYTCNCTKFWTGQNCTEDVAECAQANICGSGQCEELPGGYHCNCTGTGYNGTNCQENIDECVLDMPCYNSGLCSDTVGSYSCECKKGFTGRNCETRDFCSDSCVIKNTKNQTCVNLADRAECDCQPQWTGSNCSVMDPCHNISCTNLGTCRSTNSTPVCHCQPSFTGSRCETAVSADVNTIVAIVVPIVVVCVVLACIIALIICIVLTKKKRATRGRYSPSKNETFGLNVELSNSLKPPPEERLI